ncbi:MAG: V-type ATP synthase subunit E family protein [Myxococcales bacterium]
MKPAGSAASVLATLRDDAQAEIERIEQEAEAAVTKSALLESGTGEPADRADRLAAAARQRRDRLAREDWEDRRVALGLREEWIGQVIQEGRKLLEEPGDLGRRRALLRALADEALRRLPPGDRCTISVAARDADLIDAAFLGDRLVAGPAAPIRGGCIVRSANLVVDNSLEERERRFEAEWRAALAKAYGS